MIELGGNIKLKGFTELDAATLIVVKKIVGNYTKKLSTHHPDFDELLLELSQQEDRTFNINANFNKKTGNVSHEADGSNIFFALSRALEGVNAKSKE